MTAYKLSKICCFLDTRTTAQSPVPVLYLFYLCYSNTKLPCLLKSCVFGRFILKKVFEDIFLKCSRPIKIVALIDFSP